MALRRFHSEVLRKALESIETQGPQEKVIGSETVAFDLEQLDEVRQRVDEFLTAMSALTQKAKKKTRIYNLSVLFFNLTKGDL